MIYIRRGREPVELTEYKVRPGACYAELPPETRKAIREQLLEEQGGLCAYCMKRLIGTYQVRIEHYQARHPEGVQPEENRELDYNIMLGVCYGNSIEGGNPEQMTCDAHRGNRTLTVSPFKPHSIEQIRYSVDGTILSDNPEIEQDLNDVLNLNGEKTPLKLHRKGALDSLKKDLHQKLKGKNHQATMSYLSKLYDHYISPDDGKKKPYLGIILWYLKRKLRV